MTEREKQQKAEELAQMGAEELLSRKATLRRRYWIDMDDSAADDYYTTIRALDLLGHYNGMATYSV